MTFILDWWVGLQEMKKQTESFYRRKEIQLNLYISVLDGMTGIYNLYLKTRVHFLWFKLINFVLSSQIIIFFLHKRVPGVLCFDLNSSLASFDNSDRRTGNEIKERLYHRVTNSIFYCRQRSRCDGHKFRIDTVNNRLIGPCPFNQGD